MAMRRLSSTVIGLTIFALVDGFVIGLVAGIFAQTVAASPASIDSNEYVWLVSVDYAAAGDLSEIVGHVALKHDRQQRILGIRTTAEKGLLAATPEDREQFGAYARGVNAYIDSHRDRLPLEFRILHYSPRPWTEKDSLMIAYQMVETLSTNPTFALTREHVLAKLGPELTADLYVNTSWRDHPPTASSPTLEAPPPDRPDRRDAGSARGAHAARALDGHRPARHPAAPAGDRRSRQRR